MTSSLTKFAVAAGLVALGFTMAPAAAHAQEEDPAPTPSVPCVLVWSSAQGGTATLTVGPDGCDEPVGPLSFSAYELPTGVRWPYDLQQLIAHHPSNGSMYTAGFYTLELDLGDACNWQTDVYWGNSETIPDFGDRLINSDYVENQVCVDETTTTTSTTTTTIASETSGPTTTAVSDTETTTTDAQSAAPTTTQTDTTTTAVASAGPTTTQAASVAPTSRVGGDGGATAAAPPAGSTAALPSTGPTESLMIGLLGGALVGLGTLARRMARS